MVEQTLVQSAVIESSIGDAIVVRTGEPIKVALTGMYLQVEELLITDKSAEVIVQVNGEKVVVDMNCVAFIDWNSLVSAPVLGDISVNPNIIVQDNELGSAIELSDDVFAGIDDIAAIQDAILDGVDPTLALEATAAGEPGATSANGGFKIDV